MRVRFTAILFLAAAASVGTPAFAHHSQAMFDTTKEILVQGTIARFDLKNPHMYLIVETKGPNGEKVLVEGEGLAITQARVDGLRFEALTPGTPVVMRANPNKDAGPGKQVRILDVTTQDGEIHPFYASNTRERTLTPAKSLEGHWAPNRAALGAAFGAMARFPITPEARATQQKLVADGLCFVEPVPFLAVLDEMRSIEIGKDKVVLHFENSGDHVLRTVRMNGTHPAGVKPSRHGDSIGHWEGETLVIDTTAYEPNASGLGLNVPSSARKHTVERLTLTSERSRLRYEITVEDPVYLTKPATLTQQWDHRPDLPFSPASQACDPKVAERYRASLPK
jgi:uncharacterized protein DUF6152